MIKLDIGLRRDRRSRKFSSKDRRIRKECRKCKLPQEDDFRAWCILVEFAGRNEQSLNGERDVVVSTGVTLKK